MRNKTFRILVVIYLLIKGFKYANAQDYSGLNGYLTVDNKVWTLKFANNDYYYYTDPATISFNNADYVNEFYSDLKYAYDNSDIVIENPDYKIYSSKKNITIYNNKGQHMLVVKKYFKKGLEEIKDSLNYIK